MDGISKQSLGLMKNMIIQTGHFVFAKRCSKSFIRQFRLEAIYNLTLSYEKSKLCESFQRQLHISDKEAEPESIR